MRPTAAWALLVALALPACAGAPRPAPGALDPGADACAAQLREAHAHARDDFERAQIREELARVELKRARALHTVFAYRRFLEEFPVGEEAQTARGLLEQLRFEEADRAATPAAWEIFLDEHPRGRLAAEARARLGALELRAALGTADREQVRRVLARFPEHEQRAALVAHEDELSFAQARAGGAEALGRYLAEHPAGLHRAGAQSLLGALQRAQLLESEDLALAERRAALGDATAEDRAVVGELRLRFALRALDEPALAALADDEAAAPAARAKAREALESLRRVPLAPETRAAVEAARPGAGLRGPAELAALLGAADPLEQADALAELAEQARAQDLERVLAQLDSRYLGVRRAAVDALGALRAALRPAVWGAWAKAKEAELSATALSAPPWRRLAALREAAGDAAGAAAAWREVTRHEPDDPVARERLLALETAAGDRLARATAARDLARAAASFADERWLRPPDASLPPDERRDGPGETVGLRADLTVLRQLCTALDYARRAGDALSELRAQAGTTEKELLGLAIDENGRRLARLQAKREELELEARRRDASYRPCGPGLAGPRIEAARAAREPAIRRLGALGDRRVLPFAQSLAFSASARIRNAAAAAVAALEQAPPEPAAPAVEAPAEPAPAQKPPGGRRKPR